MHEMEGDVLEAAQNLLPAGITAAAFLVVLGILAVAITRYVLAARLRSLAQAVDIGVKNGGVRAQCEGLIHRALQAKLEKRGMVEKYAAAGQGHRGIFLLGCVCCMVALLLLITGTGYELFSDNVPALAVDTALASKYGSFFAFQDVSSNVWIVLLMTIGLATIWWVVLYVYYRGRCVWALIRGQTNVAEPDKVDRTDVVLCSIGCGFPIFAVGFVLSLVGATRTLARFEERSLGHYQGIEQLATVNKRSERTTGIRTWIRECFEGIPSGTKERSVACAAVVEAYLAGKEADPKKVQKEAEVVAECLDLLFEEGHDLTMMRAQFYESNPRWHDLSRAIARQRANEQALSSLLAAGAGEGFDVGN